MIARTPATVAGAGPNGLAAAIVLAQRKYAVTVREAKERVGGGASSAELTLPGFIHDLGSAIHPLGAGSPFFRTLGLDRFGLEWIHPPVAVAHPLDDGTAAAAYRSLDETAAGLGRDAAAYRALYGPLVRNWDQLADEFLQPVLHWPGHPLLMARFGWTAVQSAWGLCRRRFETTGARALFAGLAAHSFLPLESPLSAAFGLVLGAAAHAVGWPLPRGGSQSISEALAAHLRSLGGKVECNRPLRRYDEVPPEELLLLDLSAWNADRVSGTRLSGEARARLTRLGHGPSIFKLDYALSAPIPWRAAVCREAGTVHVGGTLEEIAAAERSVNRGEVPERPFVLVAQQSLFDPTRAPAGQHTLWAYGHVPAGCTVDMAGRVEAQIERFAPGFRDCILARHTMGARELEAFNPNLIGGDITGGASDVRSLFWRPRLVQPYRLGRKLYLCSSSTPPGGGVHGMCGYHAAWASQRDAENASAEP